ncbi:hypothetical protein D3C71_1946230 [compost metagenome]
MPVLGRQMVSANIRQQLLQLILIHSRTVIGNADMNALLHKLGCDFNSPRILQMFDSMYAGILHQR